MMIFFCKSWLVFPFKLWLYAVLVHDLAFQLTSRLEHCSLFIGHFVS